MLARRFETLGVPSRLHQSHQMAEHCEIMARLSRAMHNRLRLGRPDEVIDLAAVAQIKFVVDKVAVAAQEALLVPASVPGGPEKLARMLLSTPWTRHLRSAK